MKVSVVQLTTVKKLEDLENIDTCNPKVFEFFINRIDEFHQNRYNYRIYKMDTKCRPYIEQIETKHFLTTTESMVPIFHTSTYTKCFNKYENHLGYLSRKKIATFKKLNVKKIKILIKDNGFLEQIEIPFYDLPKSSVIRVNGDDFYRVVLTTRAGLSQQIMNALMVNRCEF